MSGDGRAALEQELQNLGTRELELESLLRDLRVRSREAGLAGQSELADKTWAVFEQMRRELTDLQVKIRALEAKVYSSRMRT